MRTSQILGEIWTFELYDAHCPQTDSVQRSPRCIKIRWSKFRDKEVIFKAVKEKKIIYIPGNPHKTINGFLSRNFEGKIIYSKY